MNVNLVTDEYDWFEQKRPTQRDLYRLALHIERYISIIGDFGSRVGDYLNLSVLASQAACIDLAQGADSEGNTARLEQSGDFYLGQNDNYIAEDSPEVSREESDQIIKSRRKTPRFSHGDIRRAPIYCLGCTISV